MTNPMTQNSDQIVLKIFSYLPNPRVWKSLIAADLCTVNIELVGDKPRKLADWLWDYDARPLAESERNKNSAYVRKSRRGFSGTLYKTDAFLTSQPFGTVPAAFSPGGHVGIFESNSILRAVARAGAQHRQLYGRDIYEASRIDSFLDANLVFAREAQVYLLALDDMTVEVHGRMQAAYEFYLAGIEQTLTQGQYLVGDALSIADISFVCDFAQFLSERRVVKKLKAQNLSPISELVATHYPHANAHMLALSQQQAFCNHLGDYLD